MPVSENHFFDLYSGHCSKQVSESDGYWPLHSIFFLQGIPALTEAWALLVPLLYHQTGVLSGI